MVAIFLIGLIFAIGGGFCCVNVLQTAQRHWAVLRDPVRVQARVLRLEPDPGSGDGDHGRDLMIPWVRYQDKTKTNHDGKLPGIFDTKKYQVGMRVPVLYQRTNPLNLVDPRSVKLELLSLGAALLMSLGGLGFGLILLFTFFQDANAQPPAQHISQE